MKKDLFFAAATLLAASVFAADSNLKDDVTVAARKLSDQNNYSWRTTVVVPEGSRFRPGPTEGKTEKGGLTYVKMSFGDNTREAVLKGDKGAVTNRDGGWESVSELDNSEGARRFLGGMVRNFKAPATQAAELVTGAKELRKEGDAYGGELTEEGAKALLSFRGGAGGSDGPTVSNAKGSVKFWLNEGTLSKYETKVSGKVSVNGNDWDVDRTSTVEIKDVGTTKLEVPEEAKKKLL